jgi:uncharacterized protein (DUF433 family)/DNA-binding transcriptional MerR regulator
MMAGGEMGDLFAFSAEHVQRVTTLSRRQLAYWDETGFFSPRYASENRRSPYSRVYSFRDLVGLRTLGVLRNKHHVPLQQLRQVAEWLAPYGPDIWATMSFCVVGRTVIFVEPTSGERIAARPPGQLVFPIHMEQVIEGTRAEANRLRERDAGDVGRVCQHRYVVRNEPVIAGTRIPTLAIWNLHEAGFDRNAIIREYPRLVPEDIDAALAFESERRARLAG